MIWHEWAFLFFFNPNKWNRYQGFTEEFIDEIKETLSSSNLYMLAMAALITAVQVRSPPHQALKKDSILICKSVCAPTAWSYTFLFGLSVSHSAPIWIIGP